MKITLLDGQVKSYDEPRKVLDIAGDIATSLKKKCVGALINGKEVVPSEAMINRDCKLELITERHELFSRVVNYTAKLVTCLALERVFPEGEVVPYEDNLDTDEFFAFFDYEKGLKFDDLKEVELEANKIIKESLEFNFNTTSLEGYVEEMKKTGSSEEFINWTLDLNEKSYIKLAIGVLGGVPFLARYATLAKTSDLFKIEFTQLTGVSVENGDVQKSIYKIHGLTAISEKDFKELVEKIEEIKASDHKNIAKNLEIYHLDPLIGQGLPIWLPNGAVLKQEIKKYLMEKEFEYDFIQIETPVIGTSDLYKTSGHWEHYRDDMFAPMFLPKEEMVLKPMSCPHHISVYNFKPRSYKDLPLRFAEHALQHRYESSGSLTGLERVRAMELTDSHIFVRPDQVKEEFKRCFNLIQEVLATFDIKVDYLSLSLRDPKDKEKYFDDDKMWNNAESELEDVLKEMDLEYKKMPGEAAFYGPKLDIQAKTSIGHEITVSTIQLDFLLPQKFDLKYIGPKGENERPIMIHRGLVGTYERFVSVLLEQTKGVLPLWCAPKQVQIIPVNIVANSDYAEQVRVELRKNLIRSEIDKRDERLSYKIREAQVRKVPYQLVLGENEQKNGTVTYRTYGSEEQITVSLQEFIDKLREKIDRKVYG
ncbi:threonyl-tRNA synthetase [Spiroplasma chinense]|uniref:Threonine--tRNA ligase n=1 Tax=Spiroplasma chinense TaxID=216932 RepID=A0A5B9Y453_9MOLU|nr:threonine--tRNA ligase [Spiroplasma chinense]QEH61543.1 threonyl-tRNA synthetase [Spiroplasma chinense]